MPAHILRPESVGLTGPPLYNGLEQMRNGAGKGLVIPGIGATDAHHDAVYARAAPHRTVRRTQQVWARLAYHLAGHARAPRYRRLGTRIGGVIGIPGGAVAHAVLIKYGFLERGGPIGGGVQHDNMQEAAFPYAAV